MFKINEYLFYQKNIYQVIDIKEKYLNNQDYYILNSILDPSLTIKLPCNNPSIRKVIDKEKVIEIINKIPNIEIIIIDNKQTDQVYKDLLNGTHEDLIKLIKSTYFDKAELLLYSEFALVLNMSFEDTKNYIIKKIKEINNEE